MLFLTIFNFKLSFMKKITFLILSVLMLTTFGSQVNAQCIATTAYGSGTISNASQTPVVFSTCNFAGERVTVTVADSGNYRFVSSVSTDFLTFTTAANVVIASGITPLDVNVATSGTYRLHVFASAACTTQSSCRATSGVSLDPPPPPPGCGETGTLCYGNSQNNSVVATYQVDNPGDEITITFTAGALESCCDYFTIYEGVGTGGAIIANNVTGTLSGLTFTAIDAITVAVTSDSSVSCGSGSGSTPAAVVDVTCNGVVVIGNPPTIACPADIVANNAAGTCGTIVNFTGVAFDIEDGNISADIIATPASGSVFPVGNTTVELSVTDSDGNTATCEFTVTVLDNEAPVAVCQDLTLDLDPVTGTVNITAADVDNGSIDNCGIASMTLDISSFDCSMIGANTVTMTVTDNSGNSTTCTSTVTIQDVTAPEVFCVGGFGIFSESEDFEGATVPSGWTTNIVLGTQDWAFGSGAMPTGGDFPTNAAIFDDDAAGSEDNIVELI